MLLKIRITAFRQFPSYCGLALSRSAPRSGFSVFFFSFFRKSRRQRANPIGTVSNPNEKKSTRDDFSGHLAKLMVISRREKTFNTRRII
ncbi:unnamed protein product [Callosobruchus maculatus]|uniref:Uncharacterized protein n=1 Tax=Callosobruchus maculatus TaxID=64391 RepID=A0A653BHV5_CALMS|nr:unnamed protein product [Callosobruchus maculatus]